MSAPDLQSQVDRNPVETPLYTVGEAAHYLRAPVWVVHGLCSSQPPPDPEWCWVRYWKRHGPFAFWLLEPGPGNSPEQLSFRQFADLYVRWFAARSLLEWPLGEDVQQDSKASTQLAAWRILAARGLQPALFRGVSPESAVVELVEACGGLLDEEGRRRLEERLRLGLERVERDEADVPARLYPFSRCPAEGSPRTIVMDPRLRFGRPTLDGRGLPTDILFERYQAGDSITALSDDYDLPVEEIEEAIRFEGWSGPPVDGAADVS